ncbi:CopG family transcriptional regulator [uncultured Thioclava sp.]|uniref:ribbon-helix-helix domain-containing protein n=1 Tax=uncultured Thioclava sp. TaxID=473858 RepID=UPI0025F4A7EB|nr:CopG family transcriptional regulator [uncultured Thioclava sp.]
MTQTRLVSIRLPVDLIALIEHEAHARDTSPAQVIRHALRVGLTPLAEPEDDPLPLALPEMRALQEALDQAQGWIDLQIRLRSAGLVLRAGGADQRLGLHEWPSDRFIIALEEIGPSLGELVLRYRAPFPGRPPEAKGASPARSESAQTPLISRRFMLPPLRPAA